MNDTNVIIHIYPGTAKNKEGEFNKKRREGITSFKEYLLEVLGHVGISFPPEPTVYGYGPNITQHDLNILRPLYENIRRSNYSRKKTKWTTINFLFDKKSPVFQGKISDDTDFFNEHDHLHNLIPLKLKNMSKERALEILTELNADYGSKFQGEERENCLTAIFNHLPLYYRNDKPVVLREPGMLRVTLAELHEGIKSQEEGVAVGTKRGGRRRRKTKRKSRKSKKTIRKRRKSKRKKRKSRRKR